MLSTTAQCTDDSLLDFPDQKLINQAVRRRSSTTRGSPSKERGRRDLRRQKKKGSGSRKSSKHDVQRMVVTCDKDVDQESCLAKLSSKGSHVRVVHDLRGHGFAIEVDSATKHDLEVMGVTVTDDALREPLYLEDTIQYHRNLAQTIPYGLGLTNVTGVWEKYGVRGEGVKICVLDTGVRATHPDFRWSNLTGYTGDEAVTPWDEDDRGHGTHITGILAASDNNEGIVGVAPGAEIYMVRVFSQNGRFYGSDVVAGM